MLPVRFAVLLGLIATAMAPGCGDSASTAKENLPTSSGGGSGAGADASSSTTGGSGGSAPQGAGVGDKQGSNAGGADAASSQAAPPMQADAGMAAGDAASSQDAAVAADGAPADAKASTCNTTEPVVLYLSADDSNSMASASVARGLILQGQYAYKPVRAYELLNYYDFAYPAALPNQVTLSAQLRKEAEPAGTYRLQVGVRAADFSEATRRRFNVVLTVDTSSSMGWGGQGDTGIDRARDACLALVAALDKGDRFSLVTWGGKVQTPIDGKLMAGKDNGELAKACNALQSQGDSPLSDGLQVAYAVAKKHLDKAAINRVILVSDGGANVGEKDAAFIAQAAKNAEGQDDGSGIYLMGAGVGDPWNYNDKLMNTVTDAGKGAYVFLDRQQEAYDVFGKGLLRHLEVAARNVQVQVTLPPSFAIDKFYGEQVSTKKEEVEPQHLAANDAMVFHQTIQSCDPASLTGKEAIKVVATWQDAQTLQLKTAQWSATLGDLIAGSHNLVDKGAAVVAYRDVLVKTQQMQGEAAAAEIKKVAESIVATSKALGGDLDLVELADLLLVYGQTYAKGQAPAYATIGSGATIEAPKCTCNGVGGDLAAMACALDVCGEGTLLSQAVKSPTDSPTAGAFAAVAQFGNPSNHLKPHLGGSYALLATGPATGTAHSQDLGGKSIADPYVAGQHGVHNAVQWRLRLKAPAGVNGIRFRHVFFSEEYDDYVGSQFNDKFYAVIEAGSTNGGVPTIINYTDCRNPQTYHDFVCSPGMQFCNPKARYCYVAINTALSECCWLNGCPNGKAKTNISGTGYECAPSQSGDGQTHGSSTGWLQTEWPIEPNEEFYLTFHVHDVGDGVFDSEVILDALQFVGKVTPGTVPVSPNL